MTRSDLEVMVVAAGSVTADRRSLVGCQSEPYDRHKTLVTRLHQRDIRAPNLSKALSTLPSLVWRVAQNSSLLPSARDGNGRA